MTWMDSNRSFSSVFYPDIMLFLACSGQYFFFLLLIKRQKKRKERCSDYFLGKTVNRWLTKRIKKELLHIPPLPNCSKKYLKKKTKETVLTLST